jgi:hypothetical protein
VIKTPAQPSANAMAMLAALQTAVNNALDKKKKLGQYAVIWENGKVVQIGEDAPKSTS